MILPRDDIAFTFASDEFNGETRGRDGQVRPEQSRLPEQSRHFTSSQKRRRRRRKSFDKTEGIAQDRRVAHDVVRDVFTPR
jgi:hypothetical protein